MRVVACLFLLALALQPGNRPALAVDVAPLLASLRAVGPKGAGHEEAARAWQELAKADAGQLPEILAGMDGAGPLATNWIALAAETVAERQLAGGGKLPAGELEKLLRDRKHAPRARSLAFDWLVRCKPTDKRRLLKGMLDDPSLELRREAVALVIDDAARAAKSSEPARAVPLYRKALTAARDMDQIKLLAARLRKAGEPVDLPRHFGLLLRWKLIGPFDNTDEKGFDVAYPPERKLDLAATHQGKHGPVKWIDYVSTHDHGRIDLNQGLVEEKKVVGYAMAEFTSEKDREVEFRCTSYNAVKLWLNGKLIDEHNVYHSGSQFDQYVCRARLKAGPNVILVKLCQNAQTQSWARPWAFQLRVCDEQGSAILSTDRPPPAAKTEKR